MGLALKDTQYHRYGDYLTWMDDLRYELIDGEAYLMAPVPDLAHQELVGKSIFKPGNRVYTSIKFFQSYAAN